MYPILDEHDVEIGWLIDAWHARCKGWSPDRVCPLPDYQSKFVKRSRSDPSLRSIPNIEYAQLAKFVKRIISLENTQQMASFVQELPQIPKTLDSGLQLCWRLSRSQFNLRGPELSNDETIASDISKWCNNLFSNQLDQEQLIFAFGRSFYLPASSSFLISDISKLCATSLISNNPRFNLILLDPPWDNKSVQRSNYYPTIRHTSLVSLPIDSLLDEKSGIVAVWVTNDPKLRSFICDEIFPKWNVQFLTVWYWLKLPLDLKIDEHALDGVHHKPYEQIVVGIRPNSAHVPKSMPVPKDRIIASFPESHSRKPVLDEIFDQFLPDRRRKLELFARDVKPGWVAWGNEPLKFQASTFFQIARPCKRQRLSEVS